ncbi:MAG TPA: methylenetetrahydrofolate reductase [Pseudomonadales bacterium]|nr:methylenetetrahydrofolate reductase [Pseudomonadales bacterium]
MTTARRFRLSFEFFPPKTDKGQTLLLETAAALDANRPVFYSVTYGAGGSTRDRTFEAVDGLISAGYAVAPHLSMGSDDKRAIEVLVDRYVDIGVKRMVALRGDIPSGFGSTRHVSYAANLVALLRAHIDAASKVPGFEIEVAAYPEMHPDAPSPQEDIEHFRRKVAAGANGAITQYFYNPDAYFDFVGRANVDVPIVPGIMPITSYANLVRFSDNCGAEIPRWIRTRLAAYQNDDESLKAFGVDVVAALCQRLIDGGAPGLHFYTLNQAGPTQAILDRIALPDG